MHFLPTVLVKVMTKDIWKNLIMGTNSKKIYQIPG